jgi:uncharacterized protein involved in exopolysaccharide biosynthesis
MTVPTASRFKRYFTVILRWLLITSVVFVLTVLTGVYITDNILPKVYTATAQIQVRPRSAINPGQETGPQIFDRTNFQAEFEIMESPDFLLPVINELGLDKTWTQRVFKSKEDELSDQDALAYMNKILKFNYVRGTNVITITASSDVPKEAADIANAIADRYKTMRDLEEDQRNSRDADRQLQQSPVRIISRAEVPTILAKPNTAHCFIVTIVGAGFLSVMAASFVEIILLFLRASERTDN